MPVGALLPVPKDSTGDDNPVADLQSDWRARRIGADVPETTVARLIEDELRQKLAIPDLSIRLDKLFASDIIGRARAFASLVNRGLEVADARVIAGLDS